MLMCMLLYPSSHPLLIPSASDERENVSPKEDPDDLHPMYPFNFTPLLLFPTHAGSAPARCPLNGPSMLPLDTVHLNALLCL